MQRYRRLSVRQFSAIPTSAIWIAGLLLLLSFPPTARSLDDLGGAGPSGARPGVDFVAGEVLVKFREGVLNPAWVEGTEQERELGTGIVDDPALRWQIEELVTPRRGRDAARLSRVFTRMRPQDRISVSRSGRLVDMGDLYNLMLLEVSAESDVPRLVRQLEALPEVEYAEPNYLQTPAATPNDPLYSLQDSLEQSNDRDIDAARAWDTTTGSSSVRVCVIDSGIDYHNVDLGNGAFGTSGAKVRGGWDYFSNDNNPDDQYNDPVIGDSHGTLVAGIIGALRNNSVGVAGIAGGSGSGNQGVLLYAQKVGGTAGGYPTGDIVDALLESASSSGFGCDVINMSFGSFNKSQSMRTVLGTAADNGAVSVAAKGNANSTQLHYPSDFDEPWVIAVGATNSLDQRAGFSNYSNTIDLAAPGVASMVHSTRRAEFGDFGDFSGTSAATPHVAGVAALLLSVQPSLHAADIEGILQASADKVGGYAYNSSGWHAQVGHGRLNAAAALDRLSAPWTLTYGTATGGSTSSAPTSYDLPVVPIWGSGNLVYGFGTRVRKTVSFSSTHTAKPFVWGRGAGASTGWGTVSPVHSVDHCKVVSSTSTSVTVETYVYNVYELDYSSGNTYGRGWFPTYPSSAKCAYSVLGIPGTPPPSVSLSGPSGLEAGQSGTWSASVSGGSGSISYQWRYRINSGSWSSVVGTSSSYSRSMPWADSMELEVTITRGGQTAKDRHVVIRIYDGGFF